MRPRCKVYCHQLICDGWSPIPSNGPNPTRRQTNRLEVPTVDGRLCGNYYRQPVPDPEKKPLLDFCRFIQRDSVNFRMRATAMGAEACALIHMPLWLRGFKNCKLWLSLISVIRCLISFDSYLHRPHWVTTRCPPPHLKSQTSVEGSSDKQVLILLKTLP